MPFSTDQGAHHSRPNVYGIGTSDDDTDLNWKPLSPHRGPFFADFSDIGSITSSGCEDEDSDLVRQHPNADDDIDSKWANFTPPPLPMRRRSTTTDINAFTMPSSLTSGVSKRPVQPPPPPPRRLTTVAAMTPPIPERKLQPFLSHRQRRLLKTTNRALHLIARATSPATERPRQFTRTPSKAWTADVEFVCIETEQGINTQ